MVAGRLICCISLALCGCVTNAPQKAVTPSAKLQQALAAMASQDVDRIDIFYMPESALAVEAISENHLEKAAWIKMSIVPFQLSKLKTKIPAKLQESSMMPYETFSGDYRWGCVFYNKRGERLTSLYLTADGYGLINGIPVRTDKRFLEFLKQEFSCLREIW